MYTYLDVLFSAVFVLSTLQDTKIYYSIASSYPIKLSNIEPSNCYKPYVNLSLGIELNRSWIPSLFTQRYEIDFSLHLALTPYANMNKKYFTFFPFQENNRDSTYGVCIRTSETKNLAILDAARGPEVSQ